MHDQRSLGFQAASQAGDVSVSSSMSSRPVRIPEPGVLPYSRLSLRAHSASSISPSPSQRILGSPGHDECLTAQQGTQGSALPSLNPGHEVPVYPRPRLGGDGVPSKRPPLPPSPQARIPGSAGSLNPLSAAWINPGDGSGSGSGGRQPRFLSAALGSSGSYADGGILSAAAAATASSGSSGCQAQQHLQQQQQQQQQYTYSSSPLGSAASFSPGGEGLLAAAVSSEDMAAAAGNPYHPQHKAAMQLLLEHQQQQLQQLQQLQQQQQRDPQVTAASSSGGRTPRQYLRSSSLGAVALSPRASPRAPSRSSSYNRLSDLGTSPGFIEASFMGMAARCNHQPSSTAGSTSRSSTLQLLMQQQEAAIRAQQEQQQRVLQHSRSSASLQEWGGHSSSGRGSAADSLPGSRATPAGTGYLSIPAVPQGLDWDAAQQQQQQQGLPPLVSSLPRVGEGRGMKALPGRQGLHWLSQADDRESAARGLLGLPRPGLRTQPGPRAQPPPLPLQQQQQQQQRSPRFDQQQQQQQQGGSAGIGSSETPAGAAAAAGEEGVRPARTVRYDPVALANFAAIIAAGPNSPRGALSSRSFGRQTSLSSSFKDRSSSSSGGPDMLRSVSMARSSSYVGMPTCLICLDQLTPSDFESGEAMYLACKCKGEVALRHRQCAEKWSRIKGNTICDVCKAPILNLPEVPPLPAPPPPPTIEDRLFQGSGLWGPLGDEPPAFADYVFDCIRVTWVVLIVCILFFELSVTRAFAIGALVGSSYVALSASLAALRRWRQQRQEDEGSGGGWVEGLHAPLLGGQAGGRGPLLPV